MHHVEANGARIPAIGFGTWTLEGDTASRLVEHAIRSGYRHIDTAAMYDNEEAVGNGIRASGVPRDDLFLTTKVWHSDLAEGDLQRSVEASLERLGVDQVDLALIHWPSRKVPLAESIAALNDVRNRGLARHIGVSNFTVALLEEAARLSQAPIVCNQVERHPFLDQSRVLSCCRRLGMALVSYCPLARGSELFAEPVVVAAARRSGKTPAQVILRWQVQREGVVAIPRSSNPGRIEENLDVFDFALEDEEMSAIDALGARNMRICDFDFAPDWDPS